MIIILKGVRQRLGMMMVSGMTERWRRMRMTRIRKASK